MEAGTEVPSRWFARTAARRPRQAHAAINRMVGALLTDDDGLAWRLAMDHLDDMGSRLAVYADLLHPAQEQLAELWYRSRISISDEGRAAEIVASLVRRMRPTPQPVRVPPGSCCLLTALGAEKHTLGLEMLRAVLEDEGWKVQLAVGQDVSSVLDRTRARRPRFVGITAGYLDTQTRLSMEALVRALDALRVPALVGGQAFNRAPDLWRQVGATGRAADLRVGLVLARRTIGGRPALRVGAA